MSRRLHVLLASVLAVSAFLSLGAEGSCSGSAALKREGEPCTRTNECASALVCTAGTCRAGGDGGVDAGSGDAGDATP